MSISRVGGGWYTTSKQWDLKMKKMELCLGGLHFPIFAHRRGRGRGSWSFASSCGYVNTCFFIGIHRDAMDGVALSLKSHNIFLDPGASSVLCVTLCWPPLPLHHQTRPLQPLYQWSHLAMWPVPHSAPKFFCQLILIFLWIFKSTFLLFFWPFHRFRVCFLFFSTFTHIYIRDMLTKVCKCTRSTVRKWTKIK